MMPRIFYAVFLVINGNAILCNNEIPHLIIFKLIKTNPLQQRNYDEKGIIK